MIGSESDGQAAFEACALQVNIAQPTFIAGLDANSLELWREKRLEKSGQLV